MIKWKYNKAAVGASIIRMGFRGPCGQMSEASTLVTGLNRKVGVSGFLIMIEWKYNLPQSLFQLLRPL